MFYITSAILLLLKLRNTIAATADKPATRATLHHAGVDDCWRRRDFETHQHVFKILLIAADYEIAVERDVLQVRHTSDVAYGRTVTPGPVELEAHIAHRNAPTKPQRTADACSARHTIKVIMTNGIQTTISR